VGAKETIDLDIRETPFQNGDLYLLCSDGLHGLVPDGKILEIVLASEGNLEKAVSNLIGAANNAGGRDNITALLLRRSSS